MMSMKASSVLILLGGVLLAVGLFLGFAPIKASGNDCGSAWRSGNDYAIVLTGGTVRDVAACEDARSGRSVVAWALLIPGILLAGAGGILAARDHNERAAAAVKPRPFDDEAFSRLGQNRKPPTT